VNNGTLALVRRRIDSLDSPHAIIAINGRCGSGKTTLALRLKEALGCNVIHMDHFFLTPGLRTESRLAEPGGNVDYERFNEAVMTPLKKALPFAYRPYDPKTQQFCEDIEIPVHRINIVEGSYSCHPLFKNNYDLKVFLTIDKAEQLRRIRQRNGEDGLQDFIEKWIPLEERYFEFTKISDQCDIIATT